MLLRFNYTLSYGTVVQLMAATGHHCSRLSDQMVLPKCPNVIDGLRGPLPGPVNTAMRNSLSCLLGSSSVPSDDETSVRETSIVCSRLVQLRYARFRDLLLGGWAVGSEAMIRAVVTCPLVGYRLHGDLYKLPKCGRRRICPFCWARSYVSETYARVAAQRENFPDAQL